MERRGSERDTYAVYEDGLQALNNLDLAVEKGLASALDVLR